MPRPLPAVAVAALLVACGAPGYQAPSVPVPARFQESARDTTPQPPELKPPAGPQAGGVPDSAAADTLAVPAVQPSVRTGDRTVDQTSYWQALGDTTLDRLVSEALRTNLDVQAALARVRGARAARTESALDLIPTVTTAAGYTRQRLSSATFPIGSGTFPDQNIWDAGFDASWELDLFGRVRRGVQAQGALIGAADADLRDVQVVLTAELARRNSENQRRTLEVTQQRLDAGRGTAFDTERARTQLGFTLASIPALEAQVASAQYALGVLVGRPPATVAAELQSVTAVPVLPADVTIPGPDSLIRHRPDVASAERQLAAGRALIGAAKAEYLPRITVGGSAGYSAGTFGSIGNNGTFRYAVGPVVSWPALNLGRVKARVDATRARADEAQARYAQTVLRAQQEVETGLLRYRTSRARVERIGDAAAASARAADLARLRFEGGVADFLQVLDAERTQLDAEDQLAQAHIDAATSYAALYQALGGALPVSPSVPR
jgi:multidrug efflux system outer membrane protein